MNTLNHFNTSSIINMTKAKIKEEISLHLLAMLAAKVGYKAILPRIDGKVYNLFF